MWTFPCPGSTPYGRDVPTSRAEAAPTIGRRARLVTAELLGWFAVSFAALSSFYLPLSVVPTSVVEQGASPVVAGWVMTTLLGSAVVAEILTPRMLRLCAARCLAAIGLAFMAVASAAVALTPTMATVVALSGLQGFGFGLLVVVVAAEIGALLPHDRRGEGLGMAGLVACVPAVTGLPAGLWLADRFGAPWSSLATTGSALLGIAVLATVPTRRAEQSPPAPHGLLAVLHTGRRHHALAFFTVAASAGVLITFLPSTTCRRHDCGNRPSAAFAGRHADASGGRPTRRSSWTSAMAGGGVGRHRCRAPPARCRGNVDDAAAGRHRLRGRLRCCTELQPDTDDAGRRDR